MLRNTDPNYWLYSSTVGLLAQKYAKPEAVVRAGLAYTAGDYNGMSDLAVIDTFINEEDEGEGAFATKRHALPTVTPVGDYIAQAIRENHVTKDDRLSALIHKQSNGEIFVDLYLIGRPDGWYEHSIMGFVVATPDEAEGRLGEVLPFVKALELDFIGFGEGDN